MEKLILVDGSGLIYRGFYAIPPFLKSPEGVQTNAVFGFTNILLSILINQKPTYVAVAFDKKGPTFRHKEFKEYKATRVKAPRELYDQIPLVKKVVEAFQMPAFEVEGFEADDILATIIKKMRDRKNLEAYVLTGDFDLFQLVSDGVSILYPMKGLKESQVIGEKEVKELYGISPKQIPDYKGLVGDSSDNIPGVKGIGPKSAVNLLDKYETLGNIYAHLNETAQATQKKLEEGKESAFLSRNLTILQYDVEIDFMLEKCRVKNFDLAAAKKIFAELGFVSLQKRLESLKGEPGGKSFQTSLFS